MRRYLPVLLLLAACGSPAEPADEPRSLSGVPAAVEAAGTVTYSAVGTRKRPDRAVETDLTMKGALDLRAGTGSADVEIPGLGPSLPALAWDRTTLTAEVDGKKETLPRGSSDGAMLARLPDEPAGLLNAIDKATEVREVASEPVDGTTHFAGLLDAADAVQGGVGTQAVETLKAGPPLELDVWVGDGNLPRRVRYRATLPPLGPLPERVVAVTYDYRDWGR